MKWYEMMFTTQWKCDDRSKGASQIRKGDKGALLRLRRPPQIKSNQIKSNQIKYPTLQLRRTPDKNQILTKRFLDENRLSEIVRVKTARTKTLSEKSYFKSTE